MVSLLVKLVIVSLIISMFGCSSVPSDLGWAFITTTVEPITATNFEQRTKVGKSCGVNLLGTVSLGDMSIDKAKYVGNIKRVSTVDSEIYSVAGIYARKCTIVTGE